MALINLSRVTSTLMTLLDARVTALYGSSVEVVPQSPDQVPSTAQHTMSVYLYHAREDAHYKNAEPPAGKIAKIRSVESWPFTPVEGQQSAGRSVGITLDRELFLERGDIIAHAGTSPRDTRRIRARVFWLHDKPLARGDSILVRLGTRETRANVVAIEKAIDPGALSSAENKQIARNHVGEIDISLAQPIAADPHGENPRTGRLVIEINGRIAAAQAQQSIGQ